MARITVEDCLDTISNRFDLIMVASKRARDLALGKVTSLLDSHIQKTHKPTILALQEIANHLITREGILNSEELSINKLQGANTHEQPPSPDIS